ncbi:Organic solute transporter Ostalpha domain containing protein [Amanita muscaria]
MTNTPSARCYMQTAQSPPSLFQNGTVVIQLHHVGWLVSGILALIATITSAWLIMKHLQWYTNKREQRYIVRILFLVPIYAIISFASYLFWNRSTPLLLVRDCYESIVLTAFFYLLLMYLSHEPEEQQRIFAKHGLSCHADREARARGEPVKKWVFPLGFVRWKPQDGLYFLQLMKYGILQYGVIRPVTTLIAVILDYVGLYCESSWSPHWGHIYISTIVSLSVTIAMYCLVQLYMPVSKLLAPHRPLLKMFSIKAVVFLTFWQATFLSLLSMIGVVKDTTYMTAEDINIGIGALLETLEMTLFAFLHIKAFSYLPYKLPPLSSKEDTPPLSTSRLRSLGHAMDFRETCREIWAGCVYIFDKARGREPSNERQARRAGHYENAFSRPRPPQRSAQAHTREKESSSRSPPHRARERTAPVHIEVEREVDIEGERQWLGTGNDYIYGLDFLSRERSDSLEVQFERELAKRGYLPAHAHPPEEPEHPNASRPGAKPVLDKDARRQSNSSWWQNIYKRLSQSDPDAEDQPPPIPPRKRRTLTRSSRRRPKSTDQNVPLLNNHPTNLDDLPPQSLLLRPHQAQQRRQERVHTSRGTEGDGDVLTPLPVFQDNRHAGLLRTPSRFPHRQSLPTAPLDRQSSLSPKLASRPISGLDIDPSFLAPMSSRSSRFSRADSLLGRLFPDTMTEGDSMSLTDFGTTNDGTHSVLSMSTEGVGQARKTPRARLTTTTPQIMTRGQASDAQGRELARQPHHVREQMQSPQEVPDPSAAELLSANLASPSGIDHRRRHSRPLPTPPMNSPIEPANYNIPWLQISPQHEPVSSNQSAATIRHYSSKDDLDIPNQREHPHDLRRTNARMRPRTMTSPPEQQTDSAHPFPPTSQQHSPISYSPPSHSSTVLPIAATKSKNATSPTRENGHHIHSSGDRGFTGSHPVQVLPGSHRSRGPPSPQSRTQAPRLPNGPSSPQSPHGIHAVHSSHNLANPYSAMNRLRKNQDSTRPARSPPSPAEIPAPSPASRNLQVTPRSSTTNVPPVRNWRSMDYQSTSWYIPAPHKS